MAVRFRLLGEIAVLIEDQPVDLGYQQQRCVLAVLLAEISRPVPADRLVEWIWGDHPPVRGRNAVYGYVSRLRSALRPTGATIRREAGGYLLTVDESDKLAVDLHLFRHLLTRARAAQDPDDALMLFDQALGLWRGTAFEDLDSPWLASMRTTLEAQRRAAELDRTDVALRCGRHAELLPELIAQTAQHPLDERLAGQVMLALYRSGRPTDALQHYQHLRTELADQLGTDPSPSLQERYQRILTADPELTAPTRPTTTAQVTPRQLPPAPAWFTGRTSELTTLTTALDNASANANTVLISALAGAGGIGKTWLVLHWAHQHLDRFPDGQLFVDLRGFSPNSDPLDPLTAVRGFLDALGVDTAHLRGGLAEHTARYRSHIAGRRMLILLDNAATTDQVAPLLPGTPSCTVLVTSRAILTPLLTQHSARHLSLDVLTDTEARALFVQHLGDARVAAEPDAVAELIRRCGRYPLALSIMASRARAHPHLPLAEFATEMCQAGLAALDDADPATSLPAVLSCSLRGLTTEQRTVFALLGIAPGPEIGLLAAVSLTGMPLSEVQAVLRTLVDASLLDRKARERYAMHDLIRDYATTIAHRDLAEQVRQAALRRVCDFYTHTADAADRVLFPHHSFVPLAPPDPGTHPQSPSDFSAALAWFVAEYPALLATQHTAARYAWHETVWRLAWALDTFHYLRGHLHDRLAVARAALDAAAHLSDPATRIIAHRLVGWAYADLGRPTEGIGHLDHALAVAERHHNTEQQAHTHRMLAWAWQRRGNDRRAGEHATRAWAQFRGLEQPVWEAEALTQMGGCAAQLGEYDLARTYCQAALALHRDHHHPDGEAGALDSLGYIAHHTGHHRQAIGCYRQALALLRALGNNYGAATILDHLGHPHAALGEHEQARAVWREALELYRRQGRDDEAGWVQRRLDRPNESY